MTRRQREMVKVLQRRVEHLGDRIEMAAEAATDFDASGNWDRSERKALRWAITVIEQADHDGALQSLSDRAGVA